ncbi:MAG: zf-TFIIB domain-containing protein [Sandaracinaceae bacterium]|nr:zf-TFIIB domain-containing protein [Sandaracinaceae bacterium]
MLEDRVCPGCHTPTLGDRPERRGVLAGLCTRCERLWLDRADLLTLVGHEPELRAPLLPGLAGTDALCPACGQAAVGERECDAGPLLCCSACGGVLLTRAVLDGLRGSQRAGAVASLVDASERVSAAPSVDAGLQRGEGPRLPTGAELRAALRRDDDAPVGDRPDRVPFDHPVVELGTFPLAAVLGWLVSSSDGAMTFVLPVQLFIHELGHAVPSWLSSRRALPLPCGVTFWEEQRSLFVGLGMAFLFGVLAVYAYRERRPFGVALSAVGLALLAFFSLAISAERSFEWTILGGVAGEFWISALMIVSFFFRLPDRLRWDFFRVLLIFPAFATWWSATRLWFGVALGTARMPMGTIFGGSHDGSGDLDRLIHAYGWSEAGLTSFYTAMALLTGASLIAAYAAVGFRRWSRSVPHRT